MSVELVTGYFGVDSGGKPKRHVSSAEDGARQAGTVGLGCYALSTGSKLSATMEDANTLVVADGDAIMNGRHVSLPDTTSFTIPTGVQGKKVSNLAVLRYEKAADSVESVIPVVLTGEPSTGEPTDPAYNEGSILDGDSPVDFPLYRVVTDGINAGDPEPLFDVLAPMAELRDLVSQQAAALSDQPKVYVRSVIKNVQNHRYVNVLTQNQIQEITGRRLDQSRGDFAICMNGDLKANSVHVTETYMADDYLTCNLSGTISAAIRINVVLIMAP